MSDVSLTATATLVSMVVGRDLVGSLDNVGVGLGMELTQSAKHRFELGVRHPPTRGEPGKATAQTAVGSGL
ncbi:unannotated protein [freshwater metagenome]